jgi:integrase
MEWGYLDCDSNPASRIRMYPEKARQFRFEQNEWVRLLGAIDELERTGAAARVRDASGRYLSEDTGIATPIAAFLRLMIFTGMRRSEGLRLRWSEVNFDLGVLELADSKTGARLVFCGPAAMAELRRLHGLRSQDTWVFEGARKGEPLKEPKFTIKRVTETGRLPMFSLHGIRHAVASHLAELGYPETPVIQGILGHRQRTVTGRYVHAARALYQEAIKAHEDGLLAR